MLTFMRNLSDFRKPLGKVENQHWARKVAIPNALGKEWDIIKRTEDL